jgi:hypothetical protein
MVGLLAKAVVRLWDKNKDAKDQNHFAVDANTNRFVEKIHVKKPIYYRRIARTKKNLVATVTRLTKLYRRTQLKKFYNADKDPGRWLAKTQAIDKTIDENRVKGLKGKGKQLRGYEIIKNSLKHHVPEAQEKLAHVKAAYDIRLMRDQIVAARANKALLNQLHPTDEYLSATGQTRTKTQRINQLWHLARTHHTPTPKEKQKKKQTVKEKTTLYSIPEGYDYNVPRRPFFK